MKWTTPKRTSTVSIFKKRLYWTSNNWKIFLLYTQTQTSTPSPKSWNYERPLTLFLETWWSHYELYTSSTKATASQNFNPHTINHSKTEDVCRLKCLLTAMIVQQSNYLHTSLNRNISTSQSPKFSTLSKNLVQSIIITLYLHYIKNQWNK